MALTFKGPGQIKCTYNIWAHVAQHRTDVCRINVIFNTSITDYHI